MKILILSDGSYMSESKDKPEIGKRYNLEDAVSGTTAQNKAFHALLTAYWKWMFKVNRFQFQDGNVIYDLSTPDDEAFKDYFKYKYGQGFSHIQYVDDDYAMQKVDTMEDIPEAVLTDFAAGNKGRIKGVLKSWAKYTKRERKACLDTLISIIGLSGCDDKKVHEILEGLEHDSN